MKVKRWWQMRPRSHMQKVHQGPLHVLVGGSGTGFTEWTHTWTREGTWSTGEDTRKHERNLPLIKGGGGSTTITMSSHGAAAPLGRQTDKQGLSSNTASSFLRFLEPFFFFFLLPPMDSFGSRREKMGQTPGQNKKNNPA